MADKSTDDNIWRVDKKIPIALVFVLITQTVGFVWAAAELSSQVEYLQKTTVRLETEIKGLRVKFDERQELYVKQQDAHREHNRIDGEIRDLRERTRDLEKTSK